MFLKSNYSKFRNIPRTLMTSYVPTILNQVKLFSVSTSKDKNKKEIVCVTPKKYADVNYSREKEYYDFENMTLTPG
jgi:hypothetical protein